MKPIIFLLRQYGFKSVLYLDDFLLISDSMQECQTNVKSTCNFLENLGFIIKYKKSKLVPSMQCTYLGFVFDSSLMSIEITQDKRISIRALIRKFKRLKKCKVREYARLVGSLVACCPAIKYSLLYTKNFEREIYCSIKG